MNPNDTIRLLILNDSRSEAERLISMLHNAGRPTRAQQVDSVEALTKLLQEQSWDLLIAHDKTANVTPADAIKNIKRLSKDVPVILQTDDEGTQPVVEGIKLGANDVVRLDEDQHLLLVIQRELENREHRQLRRSSERRFREAERRSQQLLDSSRDAIAYIQDGMYLYANESFAERFGYSDRDDIECMPVIDMVAEPDQNHVKSFLKDFILKGDDSEGSKLTYSAIHADQSSVPVELDVSHATYDEETCIQFFINAKQVNSDELEAQIEQIKFQDVVTGLYNRQYLLDTLAKSIQDAALNNQTNALLYIEIDNFASTIQEAMGVDGSDLILSQVAVILKEQSNETDVVSRFGDDSFAVLMPKINADKALAHAYELCKLFEGKIFEADGKTAQLTLSIGIALINENASDGGAIVKNAKSAAQAIQKEESNGNGAQLYEPDVPNADRRTMITKVQKALDTNRFKLLFQPIISLRGSDDEYYEVLIRMLDDNGDEHPAREFLETANSLGASAKIDRWVILESIKILAEHRKKGNKTKLLLNMSQASICDEGLLPWLGVAFKAAKLPPDAITFQLSEVDVTNHLNDAKTFTDGLTELKSHSSISKFGCSLNPFATLKHVSFDMVKVDGSFTLDIQNNNESPETLTNLLSKLNQEGKITVVPFVENASVLSTLWQAGVHYIQGHYLQAPTSAMDYEFDSEQ